MDGWILIRTDNLNATLTSLGYPQADRLIGSDGTRGVDAAAPADDAWSSNLAPTTLPPLNKNAPGGLELDWVHGYRCHDVRNNLRYTALRKVSADPNTYTRHNPDTTTDTCMQHSLFACMKKGILFEPHPPTHAPTDRVPYGERGHRDAEGPAHARLPRRAHGRRRVPRRVHSERAHARRHRTGGRVTPTTCNSDSYRTGLSYSPSS